MKIVKLITIVLSLIISIIFLCFAIYNDINNQIALNQDVTLPALSVFSYKTAEILIDYYKTLFLFQLATYATLILLTFKQKS